MIYVLADLEKNTKDVAEIKIGVSPKGAPLGLFSFLSNVKCQLFYLFLNFEYVFFFQRESYL